MPKTSVEEDGKSLFGKSKIGRARNRELTTPSDETMVSENAKKEQIGACVVAPAHAAHDHRPLSLRDGVHRSNDLIYFAWHEIACSHSRIAAAKLRGATSAKPVGIEAARPRRPP